MAEEKPRQIIISMPDRAGGLPNVIRNILIYRRCKDFRFHLFLIDESGYQGLRVYEDIPADSITRFIYDRDDNLYHVCRRVGRKLKSFGPEALLVSNSEFDLHMATVCRLNNPILHICHGDNRLVYKTAESYKPIVNHYVAVSRYIADQLASTAGIRPGRISYIPHPIAFSSYTRMPSENNLRIVFVGRLVKGKGIFLMPEIDAQLRRRQVPVEWIIIGDGLDREAFRRKWSSEARVQWMGEMPNSEIFREIARGDIFLLPSYTEGFPLVVPEAMSVGLVPIVSDLKSGIPELIEEGKTGFRCPVGDIEKMVDDICLLHNDRRTLETLSHQARNRVMDFFDPPKRAGEYEDLFKKVMTMPTYPRSFPQPLKTRILDRPFVPSTVVRFIRQMIRYFRRTQKRLIG